MARERSKNQQSESPAMERHRGGQVSRRERDWPSYGPFTMMRRFADEMDRMFEDFGFRSMQRWGGSWGIERFSPQVDIFERDGKLVLRADLPGMTKDDVKVEVTEDAVVIEGERKHEHEEKEEGVYRSERSYGRFHREIPLPEGVDTDSATANFKNGVLEVTLDASQAARNRKRLEIQSEETSRKPGQSAA